MTTLLILIAIVAYTIALLAFARGPLSANSDLVGTIINLIGTMVPLALFALSGVALRDSKPSGVMWAVVGGVAIGAFTLALTRVFASGENVSYVVPLVYGSSIALSTIIARLVYKDSVPLLQAAGVGTIVLGILLIVYSRYRHGAIA